METRNTIFRDALTSVQNMYPDIHEAKLATQIMEKMPSHFDAFGARRANDNLDEFRTILNVTDRALDKACHGFPLHLPGHVQPCRDDTKIQCNRLDQQIRR